MRKLNSSSPFAGLIILLVSGAILEGAARAGLIDDRFFPLPSVVFARLFQLMLDEPEFKVHLWASGLRLASGFTLAIGLSLATLTMASLHPIARALMNGVIAVLYPLPKSALLPFLFLLVGLNDRAHTILIAMGCATVMLATLDSGLTRLQHAGYLELSRVLGISRRHLLTKVIWPGILPELLTGAKLGAAYGLVLLIVSEMMATRYGLGVFMWTSWDQFKIVDLYSGFYLISLTGFILFSVFGLWSERASAPQKGLA